MKQPDVVQFIDLPDEAEEAPTETTEDEEVSGCRASFSFSSPTISFSVDAVAADIEKAYLVHVALKKLWEEFTRRE